jgi:hypothetical protein
MVSKDVFSGWAYECGYSEFVEETTEELQELGEDLLANFSPDSIRGSLHHPNGFLVNTLDNNPDRQLRLHIWPTGKFVGLTPHSHPWHMTSLVLAGVYTEYIPDVQIDALSQHELMGTSFNEDRKQTGNGYTGQNVRFELGSAATYLAGQFHSLPAGEFHITPLPTTEPIITLVRTSPQFFNNPTYVLSDINKELQLTNAADRQPPSEEEVIRVWEELVPILDT